MLIDNTALFRALTKTIQARESARAKKCDNKQHSDVFGEKCGSEKELVLERKCSSSLNFVNYASKAAEIRRDLIELREVVVSRRWDYIATAGHYIGLALSSGMTEWERNCMDQQVEHAITQCAKLIRAFQRQIRTDPYLRASDEQPHFEEVARILDGHLKNTAKIVTEMRSVRVKKTADMKRISRLSTLVQLYEDKVKSSPESTESLTSNNGEGKYQPKSNEKDFPLHRSFESINDNEGLRRRGIFFKDEKLREPEQKAVVPKRVDVTGDSNSEESKEEYTESFVEEDRIQLSAENERLYAKFSHAKSDIQKVEKQIVEIHRLQETFAEKVLEQEKSIGFVNEAAVNTVENIKEGNEQIREAIRNIASRRVILLFCIIVLTFTLLFLDWYNP